MNYRRFLRPESIRLALHTPAVPEPAAGEDEEAPDPGDPRNIRRVQEGVLGELVELFETTGEVANPRRLHRELCDREKKASSAAGHSIALPHVRTLQVRTFLMAFGRAREGLPFGAADGEPVRLFFALAAPPYDDRTYLKVYRSLAESLLRSGAIDRLLEVEDPSEVLLVLKETD